MSPNFATFVVSSDCIVVGVQPMKIHLGFDGNKAARHKLGSGLKTHRDYPVRNKHKRNSVLPVGLPVEHLKRDTMKLIVEKIPCGGGGGGGWIIGKLTKYIYFF